MLTITQLSSFILASVILTLLPGPDIIFVLSIAIADGKKAGIITAFGLCSGLLAHTTAAALGISAVIYKSATVFAIIKYIGAAYLLYLAISAIKNNGGLITNLELQKTDKFSLYKRGILMNILNPKVSLFFIAFLPQFVNTAENIPVQMIFLGFIFFVQALTIFICISMIAGNIGTKLMHILKNSRYINWAKATIYILIGVELTLSKG